MACSHFTFFNNLVLGLTLGAACSLALVKDTLTNAVSDLAQEKAKIFQALSYQLKSLGGPQIRNVAVCCLLFAIISV